MAWAKHKTDQADKYFSLYVRTKANWTCAKCGKYYAPPTSALHCSHFIGRSKENTRFDLQNATALCFHDHQYFTAHPAEHYQWQVARLGEPTVESLILRSNMYCKKDRTPEAIYWKQKLKDLT